ncbi:MAG TPA: alpha/beta hydrolase [Steroidobacteraceae bacterium]|nr:alpha/beta hydrolase [Steroidobacteraceae bacterium]
MNQAKLQQADPPRLRRAYFESRHGQLHVHNAIPVGGGFDELTTLICLHGTGSTGRIFLETSKRLGRTRSIYSPDLPGCGESDGSGDAMSASAYAEAIADFLDSMRFRQVDLLGVGTGAAVAVEIAVLRPKMARKVALLGMIQPEGWQPGTRLPMIKLPVLDVHAATPQHVQQAEGRLVSQLLEFFD